MPTRRVGFVDSYHASQLAHITGTSYPSTPAGNYLAIYGGSLPYSDGTTDGGSEIGPATRPAITLGTPQTDANGRQYISNTSAITGIVLTNASAAEVVGFGLMAASSGGTPIYVDRVAYPFHVQPRQTISLPIGSIRIYSGQSSL